MQLRRAVHHILRGATLLPCLGLSSLTLSTRLLASQTVALPPAAPLLTASWLSPIAAGSSVPVAAPFAVRQAASAVKQAASAAYGRLPLSFEPNVGQVNPRAQFLCRGAGYSLFLTPTGAVLAMQRPAPSPRLAKRNGHCLPPQREAKPTPPQGVALYMTLLGANPQAQGVGEDKQSGVVSYFVGKDRSQWHSGIATFGQVRYRNVYPGMDLLYYGNQSQLEYDLIVSPGGDYHKAALQFAGARRVTLDRSGNLQLNLAGGETVWKHPVAYQVDGEGKRQWVASRYVLNRKTKTVRFVVGRYDRSRTLVLDPGLVYSTFLGGSGVGFPNSNGDTGNAVAVDNAGNLYMGGTAYSSDFPTTAGAFQTTNKGNSGVASNVFVTKLSADGKSLLYSTYLGGFFNASCSGIAVDANGSAYVTGSPSAGDFPTTPGAFQPNSLSANIFVTKLSADGKSLLYSTYLAGSSGDNDTSTGIAVDGNGNAYVAGMTGATDFPTTSGAFQTVNKCRTGGNPFNLTVGTNAFITKLNATGTALVYSTYLGGSGIIDGTHGLNPHGDGASAIAVDSQGNAYVTGYTYSTDFPLTPGAVQTLNKASSNTAPDAFITKLNASGTALLYSTYLGGSGRSSGIGGYPGQGDKATAIAVDGSGNAYVTGTTASTDFPVIFPGAFQPNPGDAFVTKLTPGGTALAYSTYLASLGSGKSIAVDANGNAYVATNSDVITRVNPSGTAGVYSVHFGGISTSLALDANANLVVTGSATALLTTPGALQTTNHAAANQTTNAFALKLSVAAWAPRLDVNGDGKLDLLWQNTTTGDLTAWLQNKTRTTGPAILATGVDTRWRVTAVADLNGDGSADILWRNQITGDLTVWYMQGGTYTGAATIARSVPLAWQVVSAADFNNDNNPDLLLYNTRTGDVAVWYMQGASNIGYAYLAKSVPLNWQLVGCTDFYDTGHVDLLWRNVQSGDVAVWDMNNTQLVTGYTLAKAVSLEWQVSAVGDLDGNGVPDIVWRNVKTGDVAAWLFDDPIHYTGASIAAGVPLNWQLVGPR